VILANDFFTIESLGSFAGATSATVCVANGIQRAFNFSPKWLALAASEFVCLSLVAITPISDQTPIAAPYIIAFLNGFLVFFASAGLTELGSDLKEKFPSSPKSPKSRSFGSGGGAVRGFWTSWFKY
jgi:hypothetical protein